ncbi:2-nitropropane dioxygenase [Terrisporobacter othiniensis]|uniref:Probable nitronate monooxygenase n=1 Tax=Terrisporobacter othiniensis TaxID=1577792 RepID=A0A0B3VXK6_9FIRM|nr:nitronate monooxygenase family protein [Terrisporobacter othiniensis]KHS57359.1 2-nitropropane dioxygenase [Terrisporobacter othiniensis]
MKELVIGNLIAKMPVIQGGMGIGISRSSLASAVSNAGGIGIISGVSIGYDEDDFENNTLEANLRALKKHLIIAKEKSNNGIIGVNLMVAMNYYEDHVKAAVESGCDLIISGAGLPLQLPKLVKNSNTKIAPIVSSSKAAHVILKMWDKKDNTTADLIIVEGPKAGGHLGFSNDELDDIKSINYDDEFIKILDITKKYEEKYNKKIPVIAAGGISSGIDVKKYLDLGAGGVQVGTRFVATHECDAHDNFKQTYINAKEEDIKIVKSPVGLPGRAIKNKFIDTILCSRPKITKCYNCLVPCNPKNTPYCISTALINAVKGNVDDALLFCGADAYKINELKSVKEVMNELTCEI